MQDPGNSLNTDLKEGKPKSRCNSGAWVLRESTQIECTEGADSSPLTHLDILLGEPWPSHLLLPFPHKASNRATRALILGVLTERQPVLETEL